MLDWKQNLARVEDEPGLAKDTYTGAVIDNNTESYQNYLAMRQRRLQQQEQIDILTTRINNVETGITDIKDLLNRLLDNKNGHNH